MINISAEIKYALLGILALILFIAFFIWGISDAEKREKREFFECTNRTQDIEWCYDKFILD